jgi:protein SCO1
MSEGRTSGGSPTEPAALFDGAFRLVVVFAVVLVALTAVRLVSDAIAPRGGGPVAAATPSPSAVIDVAAYLEPTARAAPALALTGPGGTPVSLEAMRGEPVLVFFGYTHCPDVCPATIGTVGEAIATRGAGARAILVSVDPERDTPDWLTEYVRYMPAGFTAVTGSPEEVRAAANDWGVRYARVDGHDAGSYSMAHTADVFVVDGDGMLRARFPFGTNAATMVEVLRAIEATSVRPTAAPTAAPPSVRPSPGASPGAIGVLTPDLVSSSVWAGGSSPMIFTLLGGDDGPEDAALDVTVQLLEGDGQPAGPVIQATAVRPKGIATLSFVAFVDLPSPDAWRFLVTATDSSGAIRQGPMRITALDPGGSAPLGVPAPPIRTSTGADFGGNLAWVSTDPLPNPRLSRTSTADALAAGLPFVLVVDSYSFKVTEACGQAVILAKRLLDRWTEVPFIHHEPYRYSVVTTQPVLEGTLENPRLTEVAEAWGVGSAPWGAASMPWVFIVDGDGVVRAKYQGILGSADIDVLLSLLTAGA